jgi:5-azacytidine-induced protein 1
VSAGSSSAGQQQQHHVQQQAQQQQQQQQQQPAAAGADKLSTILAYLDSVEASAEQEASLAAVQPR